MISPRKIKNTSGFTLVELIIVIAILGILATVILTVLNPLVQVQKARDAGRRAGLKQVQNALEQYFNDNAAYPATSCWSGTPTCWTPSGGLALFGAKASNYLPTMPQDPAVTVADCTFTTSRGYYYYALDGGKTYKLITAMENTSDPTVQPGAPNYYSNAIDGGGCSTAFNFKLVNQQQ